MSNATHKSFALALASMLALTPAQAQQYPGGSHAIAGPQGTLVINSGFVNNLNVHTFQVYSFLFKPKSQTGSWHQVPVMEGDDASNLKFVVTTANTADFSLRDAKVSVSGQKLLLHVVQKKYKDTPYDDDAKVEVRRYELQKLPDEQRWIFRLMSVRDAGTKTTVEQALHLIPTPPRAGTTRPK